MIITLVFFFLCRAKLASLFGLDQDTSQGNESFQYTAPKQPSKGSNASGEPLDVKTEGLDGTWTLSKCVFLCLYSTTCTKTSSTTRRSSSVIRHSSPSLQIVRRLFIIFIIMMEFCHAFYKSVACEHSLHASPQSLKT